MLVGEVVDEYGTPNDFIGHAGGDNFIIITTEGKSDTIRKHLKERFVEQVLTHYNFMDRQQGYISASGTGGEVVQAGLMSLSVGTVAPSQHQFADIREITELAAEARRADQ
jgi:GGDEF domain-containing protein